MSTGQDKSKFGNRNIGVGQTPGNVTVIFQELNR